MTTDRREMPAALKVVLFAYALSVATVLFDRIFRIHVFPHAGGLFLVAFAFVNPLAGVIGLTLSSRGLSARPRANGAALALSVGLLLPYVIAVLRNLG